MKGFVPTPTSTVDLMVDRLFRNRPPKKTSRLLDPGCGHGAFIEGVLRWCLRHSASRPSIVGIELDPEKLDRAKNRLGDEQAVTLLNGDFLTQEFGHFDYVIGNPPYVAIEELSEGERHLYRGRFETARGRLDLYMLFWERALQLLNAEGRLVFITPEKYIYVESARPLRAILSRHEVEEIIYAPEDTFSGLTTYPTITTVNHRASRNPTAVYSRDGESHHVHLPRNGDSWQPAINNSPLMKGGRTLADVTVRISCGVATGADKMFLFQSDNLPGGLARFSHPTLAGRELRPGKPLPSSRRVLVVPYDRHRRLLPLENLGSLAEYLSNDCVRKRLEARTCVQRKPWYAFHETPPLDEMLRPKLLCKDITAQPYFWVEGRGNVVPLHSTYYIVPRATELLEPLADFLNSKVVHVWLRANCQRAANGFLRIQSAILKKLPIPDSLIDYRQAHAI